MSAITMNPFDIRQKHAIRQHVNDMDKSTIISIFPKAFEERKETLQPSVFRMDKGSIDNPAILVVSSCSWFRDVDEHAPLVEIPVSSIVIAKSVVEDYVSGIIGYRKEIAQPGIFYMPGEHTLAKLKTNATYLQLLAHYKTIQNQWYQDLVMMGDRDWARSNGNPLSVSADMKMAAQELQIKDKPWMKDFTNTQMINCKACDFRIMPHVIVCPNCKLILNTEEAKKLGLVFAS